LFAAPQIRECSLGEGSIGILPGQYFDTETGLHYNGFRDYDPSTGRYVESDLIGIGGGTNTYGYGDSDPIFAVDVFGLEGSVMDPSPFSVRNSQECLKANCHGIANSPDRRYLTSLETENLVVAWDLAVAATGLFGTISAISSDTRVVHQYTLRAAGRGFYPVMTRGSKMATDLKWCERDEIWKVGTTWNPKDRYSGPELRGIGEYGVTLQKEFAGSETESLLLEKMKIRNYMEQTGALPPGNKINR
jgi:RHS repeat-associated protein